MTDVAEVAVLRCLADGPGAPLALTVDIFFQYFVHFVLDLHALCSRRPAGVILCVLLVFFPRFSVSMLRALRARNCGGAATWFDAEFGWSVRAGKGACNSAEGGDV